MKPKELQFPSGERDPFFSAPLLFIPEQFVSEDSSIVVPDFFLDSLPIALELCAGNGGWVVGRAERGDKNWIAVERRFDRVRKIWSKIHNHRLKNLFVVSGRAEIFLSHFLRDGSVDEIFVNFPDPWPKRRHAHHRLFQTSFVSNVARVMKPLGRVTVVTDDAAYGEQIVASFLLSSNCWRALFPLPYFITEWPEYGSSFFEELWRKKGREIRYFQFEKKEM